MKLRTCETASMHWSRPGILCLALVLVACSHDKVAATEPAKAESSETIPAVKKPEITTPAVTEPAMQKPVASSELAALKPGQTAKMDESSTLHYVRLVSDSRCPVGTQCIWAGEATIELTIESGNEKQTFTLTDRANTKEVLGFSIELVSIDRGHLVSIRARKL